MIFVFSCQKKVVLLPSDDRIRDGVDFCTNEDIQINWVCMSKANFVEQEKLLIQCREVLKSGL